MFQNLKFYREVGLFDLISPPIHEDGRWDSAFLEQCFQQRLASGVRFLGLDLNGVMDFPVATLRLLREVQQQVRPERGHVVVLGANEVCSKILEPLKETAGVLLFQREEELISWSFQNPEGQAFGTDIVQDLAMESLNTGFADSAHGDENLDSDTVMDANLGAELLAEPFLPHPTEQQRQETSKLSPVNRALESDFGSSTGSEINSTKDGMSQPKSSDLADSNQPAVSKVTTQAASEDRESKADLTKPSSAPWGEEKESSPLLWILILLAIAIGVGAYFL